MSADAPQRWRAVQVRHLVGFEAVVRAGSFRAAADDLGYSQPAISQQLARLERLVGARLMQRAPGSEPLALTPAGEVLLGHARRILSRFDAARSDIASRPAALVVSVGASPSLAAPVIAHATARLAGSHPDLEVR